MTILTRPASFRLTTPTGPVDLCCDCRGALGLGIDLPGMDGRLIVADAHHAAPAPTGTTCAACAADPVTTATPDAVAERQRLGRKLERPFYVKEMLARWATCPVAYRTQEEAEAAAASATDCAHADVLDCSGGPKGVLVARYSKGRKVDW